MSSQRAPGTYVPMLIPRGHGYPLWVPRPHVDSPIMNRGIEIGDLGYLADDGSFVFLFNVCHDAEDEVNREGVPPGFVPLCIPDNGTLTDPERYTKNSAILSYGMKQKSISLDISAAVPCVCFHLQTLPFFTDLIQVASLVRWARVLNLQVQGRRGPSSSCPMAVEVMIPNILAYLKNTGRPMPVVGSNISMARHSAGKSVAVCFTL